MSTYRLDKLFAPAFIAVVGASPKPGSLGGVVLKGLQEGGFKGALHAVNPRYGEVLGIPCRATLDALPAAPDLVIVATPAHAVLQVITDAVHAGAQTAIILTAGLGRGAGSVAEQAHAIARMAGLRLVGPNCLGVLAPRIALNASFAARVPKAGPLALVSQSGAIAAGLAEWAIQRGIGFSGIVSLGDAIDVDFGDCLDYFAEDNSTTAIILYIEAITNARKFMSAARKAVRVKPVILIKAGRHVEGAKAAATHTGALAGSDAVYDAAFQRAGCLRVRGLDELFAIVGALETQPITSHDRITILTNGGGLGVLAVDRLVDLSGQLAPLPDALRSALDKLLPATWSGSNPVDIIGDSPAGRYADALNVLLKADQHDAIVVMNCPTALTSAADAADAVISAIAADARASGLNKPVFSVWLGADAEQRGAFERVGIPSFETESAAIFAASQMIRLGRMRAGLLAIPEPLPRSIAPDRQAAAAAISAALGDPRAWLDPVEVHQVLNAYGIASTPVRLAADAVHAAALAAEFLKDGGACVVKIQSRDIVHKSDVDGVRLGLGNGDAVKDAASDILARAHSLRPKARLDGVTIQPMIHKPHARELIIGVVVDPTFGPVILFGHGGTAVEVINDKALALLPLDLGQARALIADTRVSRLLAGYRNVPAANLDALAMMLVRVSRLIEDHPEITGLDLNPVLADDADVLALDARIQVAPFPENDRALASARRFAIRPYPRDLEQLADLADGRRLLVRPIRPTDAAALTAMLKACDADDLRMRFFSAMRVVDTALIARLTQIDYAREMAFVAIDPATHDILGVVRLHGDANGASGEFAILVRTDQQGAGIGHDLMTRVIAFARAEGYRSIMGQVLADNSPMLGMCKALGFQSQFGPVGDGVVIVRLALMPSQT
jgi:acetyltransferase